MLAPKFLVCEFCLQYQENRAKYKKIAPTCYYSFCNMRKLNINKKHFKLNNATIKAYNFFFFKQERQIRKKNNHFCTDFISKKGEKFPSDSELEL